MPRPSELSQNGRDDLRSAIARFGGCKRICRQAGLVPYRDWFYFDRLLELLIELRRYLDQYQKGRYDVFPTMSHVQERNPQLYSLVQYYGGRKFVASRLGMLYRSTSKSQSKSANDIAEEKDMNWGPFSLEFGILLMTFIREDHTRKNPPLRNPTMNMPSKKRLDNDENGARLDEQIEQFGGYENVARRLGLAYFAR
jgi:hypothetical protein